MASEPFCQYVLDVCAAPLCEDEHREVLIDITDAMHGSVSLFHGTDHDDTRRRGISLDAIISPLRTNPPSMRHEPLVRKAGVAFRVAHGVLVCP